MIKYKNLRQKLVKTAIVTTVTASLLGAAAFGAYTWYSSVEQELRRAEGSVQSARNDLMSRQNKASEAEKYMGLYQQLIGDSEQEKLSDLNREKAQKWISSIAKELHMSKLEGDFDPVTDIQAPEFKKTTLHGVNSKVRLTFGAMSDEQLYRFVQAIARDFPGYVRITRVNFEKKGEIDDAALVAAGRGNFPELVSGSIEFNWIAVKKNAQADNANQNQQGQQW